MANKTIQLDETVTVGALAEKLDIPTTQLIGELLKNGVMATVNEAIDFETAQIIVEELGLEVKLDKQSEQAPPVAQKRKTSTEGTPRPPVVAVMGHIDHGKTTLLDAITKSKTASQEAGGITQHISAYQISHKNQKITFLDTPGHEAFAAIREHGAHLTDIVVLVVAADDGVKPQTKEAIRFAKKAGVKILVAINKIDKPGADIPKVKQELSDQGLTIEEWGGDIVTVEVSALKNQGIDSLLDMITLMSEVEGLKAKTDSPAEGLIIEAHMERGRGALGTALIDSGALSPGDYLVSGATYAKIRTLELSNGGKLSSAGPSTPVVISGFKSLPRFGAKFNVVDNEKAARQSALNNKNAMQAQGNMVATSGMELIQKIDKQRTTKELNVIVKTDVQGSLKSIIDSLRTLESEDVKTRIISYGVGQINEKDIHLASSSSSILYGFKSTIPRNVRRQADEAEVNVRIFDVIYELIEDVKSEMEKLLPKKIKRTDIGRLLVRGVFKTTKTDIICGGEVTKGQLSLPSIATAYREDEVIADRLRVIGLRQGPQETKEVKSGEMCGVNLKTDEKVQLQEGDKLEFFTEEVLESKL